MAKPRHPFTLLALDPGELPGALRECVQLTLARDWPGAERALRGWLAAGAAPEPRLAGAALEHLLFLRYQTGRVAGMAEDLRAPWSPVREAADEQFDARYARAHAETGSDPLPLRRRARFYGLAQLLAATRGADGEVAECGCFRGLSAHLLCQVLAAERAGFDGSGMHVFDSFAGLSAPMPEDAVAGEDERAQELRAMCTEGRFAAPLALVRRNLAAFPGVRLYRGWIPLSFDALPERRYRFVHLDVDLHDPTLDSLEYFHPRLAPGGLIVSDDYGWPGARRAIEDFCGGRGIAFRVTEHEQAVIGARDSG